MKSFCSLLAFTALACSFVAAAPGLANVNPYSGYEGFNSPVWRPKVNAAASRFAAQGKSELARQAREAVKVPTFMWIAETAAIPNIPVWLAEARQVQSSTGKKQVVQIVVYNLPDRDCGSNASSGELSYANGGKEKYEQFIQTIRGHLAIYPDVRVVIQLETDAIGNMVTSQSSPKCATNSAAQKASYAYAVANLQLANVALYIDGAQAGWLGWPDKIGPAADTMYQILQDAKKLNPEAVIRGISTDVSNYNGYNDPTLAQGYDELVYIKNLAPLLAAKGWNAKFIVDQGRSGNQKVARPGIEWCNFKYAGFGNRPSTNTGNSLVDSFVWVKPPGESDGTTDRASSRFDATCVSNSSIIPMPESGQWSDTAFEIALVYANPAF